MALIRQVTPCYNEWGRMRHLCRFMQECHVCDDILWEAWERQHFGGCAVLGPQQGVNPGGRYVISVEWS